MLYVLYFIHIIICIFLILVVLLQQGKGADLSVFGGGSTQAAFGARGAATLLHKLTVTFFVLFIVTTLSIGIFQRSGTSGSSVMADVETPKPAAKGAEAAEAVVIEEDGQVLEVEALTPSEAVVEEIVDSELEEVAPETPETP